MPRDGAETSKTAPYWHTPGAWRRDRAPPLAGVLAAGATPLGSPAPVGVPVGELVEFSRHLDVGPGDIRVAGVVLALEGVNVPLVPARKPGHGLVGAAFAALDGDVADVDGAVALGIGHAGSLAAAA